MTAQKHTRTQTHKHNTEKGQKPDVPNGRQTRSKDRANKCEENRQSNDYGTGEHTELSERETKTQLKTIAKTGSEINNT